MDDTPYTNMPSPSRPGSRSNDAADLAHWKAVVHGLSAEIANTLTLALERIENLAVTGQIDRGDLRALHLEVQQARQTSMAGQQLARLASGQLRQTPERLNLMEAVNAAWRSHVQELESRDIAVHQVLQSADVLVDASLLFNLIESLINWGATHADGGIEIRIDVDGQPKRSRLVSRFKLRVRSGPLQDGRQLDTVTWRLLEQTAWTMGLALSREVLDDWVELQIAFPQPQGDALDGMSTIELDQGYSPSVSAKILANSHVLVVASRREVRAQVRHALRNMGLAVDFVNSMEDASRFCGDGGQHPHAVIFESILRGDRFNQLRSEVGAGETKVVFIEILEEGNNFEISGIGNVQMARVGRDALLTALPSALTFELAKTV